jgi:hypothetical protein
MSLHFHLFMNIFVNLLRVTANLLMRVKNELIIHLFIDCFMCCWWCVIVAT